MQFRALIKKRRLVFVDRLVHVNGVIVVRGLAVFQTKLGKNHRYAAVGKTPY